MDFRFAGLIFERDFPCALASNGVKENAAGIFSFTVPPCSILLRFSTQAVVFDASCPAVIFSQAYDVSC